MTTPQSTAGLAALLRALLDDAPPGNDTWDDYNAGRRDALALILGLCAGEQTHEGGGLSDVAMGNAGSYAVQRAGDRGVRAQPQPHADARALILARAWWSACTTASRETEPA